MAAARRGEGEHRSSAGLLAAPQEPLLPVEGALVVTGPGGCEEVLPHRRRLAGQARELVDVAGVVAARAAVEDAVARRQVGRRAGARRQDKQRQDGEKGEAAHHFLFRKLAALSLDDY